MSSTETKDTKIKKQGNLMFQLRCNLCLCFVLLFASCASPDEPSAIISDAEGDISALNDAPSASDSAPLADFEWAADAAMIEDAMSIKEDASDLLIIDALFPIDDA
ncbi:hypothetical protein KKF91_20720, partial [Myxococcota bacterium]|nr:hypothetical protein [Myxococcota bacterium]